MRCISNISEYSGTDGKSFSLVKQRPPKGSQWPWAEVLEDTKHHFAFFIILMSPLALPQSPAFASPSRVHLYNVCHGSHARSKPRSHFKDKSLKASWRMGQRERRKTVIINPEKCICLFIYWGPLCMKPWIKNDLKNIGMIYNLPKHKLFLEEKNTC